MSAAASPEVRLTVIIPTLCESKRAQTLLRAIDSIGASISEPVRIVVVVNGQRFDPGLVAKLRSDARVDVLQLEEGSATAAQRAGRASVTTEFFSFLDDDDEYLPGASDQRLQLMAAHSTAAVAVSAGWLCEDGVDSEMYTRMAYVARDPLAELFEENWLHNCNATFRTALVPVRYFEDPHRMMEWTWLAFRLAMDGLRVVASETPAFRYYDTPGSLSKSEIFTRSRTTLYPRMLAMNPPMAVQRVIRQRMSAAWHEVSKMELIAGRRWAALKAHLRSLTVDFSGLRYLSYSRYFVTGEQVRLDA